MRYWKEWIKAASIRAIKTIAQSALGMLTIGAAMSEVNWLNVASVSLVAGIYSLLTSLAGLPELEAKDGYYDDPDDLEPNIPEDDNEVGGTNA